MREAIIEKKLIREVESRGGCALKMNSASMKGLPDRLILLPGGKIGFVETKASDKAPRANQVYAMRMLQKLDFKVFIIDSSEKIGGVIDAIQAT